jgi:serine/threonine protein kinase
MDDRVGQRFGDYRLTRFLGSGSFGVVYLGEHVHEHTPAAVKLLQARLAAQDLKDFINEANTLFLLQHPHVVRLLGFGIGKDDTAFLAMAYAPNGTLRQRHPRDTQLPLPWIVQYVKPIASALQAAHDKRLIHRDVKPENILLGPINEVWLSDFGIVALAHSSRSLETEKPGGSIPYMAPEQLRGKPCPASDQYALGIMAYEWLCGVRPFGGTATEVAMQHLIEPPPSLHEKVPTIAPEVEQVVLKALAKKPEERFSSVKAFANALEQASQSKQSPFEKLQASPPSLAPAVEKPLAPPPVPPMQLAAVSPLPPTLYGGDSPLREASFSASDNAATEVEPVVGPSGGKVVPPESKDEKVNLWKIGKRQVVAGLIGFAIVVCLSIATGLLPLRSPSWFIIVGLILFVLVVVTPEFFGAVFGPWVGLFTGVGPLVGSIFGSALLVFFYDSNLSRSNLPSRSAR